jgi:hypothetical protein
MLCDVFRKHSHKNVILAERLTDLSRETTLAGAQPKDPGRAWAAMKGIEMLKLGEFLRRGQGKGLNAYRWEASCSATLPKISKKSP